MTHVVGKPAPSSQCLYKGNSKQTEWVSSTPKKGWRLSHLFGDPAAYMSSA